MPQSNAHQPSPDWHWARAYYFEPRKDDLIVDGVWPALQAATGGGRRCEVLFQRDWVGGPNVLIGFAPGDSAAAAMEEAAHAIRRYLGERPSTTELERRKWAASIRTLAQHEGRLEQADLALQPDNTVLTGCQEPVSPLLRDPVLRDHIRRRLCESAAMVVPWLRLVRSRLQERGDVALQALVTMVWVANPGRLSAAASFYSHAGGFLKQADRNGQLRSQFEARYLGPSGAQARQIVERTTSNLRASTADPLNVTAFAQWLQSTLTNLRDALERQAFGPHVAMERASSRAQALDLAPAGVERQVVALLNTSATFRAWQLTVNLVYLMLNQLGIQPLQRYLACYLLYRAIDDLVGLPAEDIGRELLRTGDTTMMLPVFASANESATRAVSSDSRRH